ncbi:hypothetical protein HHK36_026987 [Tetracentron sinense]|uniref:7-hydroxymethyl chlorophyll a reductase n=1 Tax=Tetracentron sinense TaxID=13715 RepID=A0A835D354_TETSI|nr:hypothetical protein HHK36_026987 [Tetracentron sinense]
MASAQVLPNSAASSRKQGHLEAGKRRLEEFRKKKAAERAQKAVSTGQLHSTDVRQYEKQPQESERIRITDSDGAGTSERDGGAVTEPSGVYTSDESKSMDFSQTSELGTLDGAHASPPISAYKYTASFADPVQNSAKNQESKWYDGSGLPGPDYVNYDLQNKEKNNGQSDSVPVQSIELGYTRASGNISTLYEESAPAVEQDMHASVDFGPMMFDRWGRKLSGSTDHLPSAESAPLQTSVSLSTDFDFDFGSSSNHIPLYSAISETGTQRSRSSFLDSLNVPRVSSLSFPFTEPEKAETFISKSSKVHSVDVLPSSVSQNPFTETEAMRPFAKLKTSNLLTAPEPNVKISISASNEGELVRQIVKENSTERMHTFHLAKHDEDFAALEQHIDDLTQEKFSLQRALEASRALADSLAVENSSLTDSYNQQEEIKAQLVELESAKMEYTNAQLECNAADERAKLLSSEVIGLEEKALRLRSSELKLERQLENSNAEISSYQSEANIGWKHEVPYEGDKLKALDIRECDETRHFASLGCSQSMSVSEPPVDLSLTSRKKMSTLEKERQDLQSMINALQEEKKILQSKLRKASASGKSIDVSKTPSNTKDVSTSTEDLGVEVFNSVHGESSGADAMLNTVNHEIQDTSSFRPSSTSSFPLLPENEQFSLEITPANIPPNQLRMIGNINSLISELSLEKDELMRSLAAESSHSFKLKDLNKELSRKLEAQTQRLELLTAKSMASEVIPVKQADSRNMYDNTMYTDEGDEIKLSNIKSTLAKKEQQSKSLLHLSSASMASCIAIAKLSSFPLTLSIVSSSSSSSSSSQESNSKSKSSSVKLRDDWRKRSKPIPPGGTYPAKDQCSQCGLCDTYYIAHVKNACAFLGDGMSRIEGLEPIVHGRGRKVGSLDETYLGVHEQLLYARKTEPVEGAQWTGIVTTIAIEMLKANMVDAVICVQSDPEDRLTPRPVLARTPDEVLAARGVKPTLSPNLNTLALVEAAGVKRLLFCGVGCQVQALRSIEQHLNLEKLYVLGTNCVDNGTREGLEKFLKAASNDPETVLHYEFMQDYKVHLKHLDGHIEEVPYFCLPANELVDVIAPSCYR